METYKLNTDYDLEYYKKEYLKYYSKYNESFMKETALFIANYELKDKIGELEDELNQRRKPYTFKLQISK